jgi:hypothetical protein
MNPSTPDKRRRWRAHWLMVAAFRLRRGMGASVQKPPLPEDLKGLTCGAKTRAGTPCKSRALHMNGRCKFHGGLSTGPKTEAGRMQSRANGKQRGKKQLFVPCEPICVPRAHVCVPNSMKPGGTHSSTQENLDTSVATVHVDTAQKNLTPCRCSECASLSAAHTCIAAQRGELGPDAPVVNNVNTPRHCPAFSQSPWALSY